MTGLPWFLPVSSFAIGIVCTILIAALARRIGLVDHPDSFRKMHRKPIPLAGGLAIFATCFVVLSTVFGFDLIPGVGSVLDEPWLFALLAACVVICTIGVFDDFYAMRGRYKLVGQMIAICIVVASMPPIRELRVFGWNVEMSHWVGYIFTMLWLVGAVNSLNLIDGMDGFLGTVGGIIAITLAIMASWTGHMLEATIALTLVGAIGGFLCLNRPPARVYLGDCGSMLIGLLIGVLALRSSLKSSTTLMIAAPIALLTLPLFDTFAAITRRTLTGRGIYTCDRGHIQHTLQARFSRYRVLALIAMLSSLAAGGALASVRLEDEIFAMLASLAVIGILIVAGMFGTAETRLVRKRLGSAYRRLRFGHQVGRVIDFQAHLQGSVRWNEVWQNLVTLATQLNLTTLRLDVNAPSIHESYYAHGVRNSPDAPNCWRTELPLMLNGHIIGRLEIVGVRDTELIWDKIALLARIADEIESLMCRISEDQRAKVAAAAMAEATTRAPGSSTMLIPMSLWRRSELDAARSV